MSGTQITVSAPVTLVGGGALDAALVAEARRIAPRLIAADGAADRLHGLGLWPEAIVGDLDSLAAPALWQARGVAVHRVAEQDSTDFEKCLRLVDAPACLGVGFLGRRQDHALAALTALMRAPLPTVLLGRHEALTHCPGGSVLRVDLAPGDAVSIWPLAEVTGVRSRGLEWPVEGLTLAPWGRVGTSNRATGPVEIGFDRDGAIVMLARSALPALFAARLAMAAGGA